MVKIISEIEKRGIKPLAKGGIKPLDKGGIKPPMRRLTF